MRPDYDTPTPLMEIIKAINTAGLYTTVVSNRSAFAIKVEEKARAIAVISLPAFFWLSHSEMCRPQEGFYAELLQALITRSGIADQRFVVPHRLHSEP